MIGENEKKAFLDVLSSMRVYNEARDTVETDGDLVEITTKTGKILSFYLHEEKTAGVASTQLTFIDEKGKKTMGTIHDLTDQEDVKAGLRKVFM